MSEFQRKLKNPSILESVQCLVSGHDLMPFLKEMAKCAYTDLPKIPHPPCLDKLFKPCSYLSGQPQVVPSARQWRRSENFGSEGDVTNILSFTVPYTTYSSVNELICLLRKGNNCLLVGMTITILLKVWVPYSLSHLLPLQCFFFSFCFFF